MKKLLLLIVCTALLSSVNTVKAQTKEKGLFIEASIAYGSSHAKNFAIITPTAGYQFKRWAAGMKISFETGDYGYTTYTPFVRFNFLQLRLLNLFTEAQYNHSSRDVEGGQCEYKEVGLSFGLSCPLGEHINIVGHYLFVGYNNKRDREGAWWGDKDFALDANIQRLRLGIQYIF